MYGGNEFTAAYGSIVRSQVARIQAVGNLLEEPVCLLRGELCRPLQGVALVWGVALDVQIWSVWPSSITLLGGSIVIGTGLSMLAREWRAAAR